VSWNETSWSSHGRSRQEGVECMRSAAAELSRAETEVHGLVERADGSFELTDLSG
jgi:hypothetical protein